MRKMFERILIATDGSEKNQPAVRKSVEIARECGSTLYAIYVIDNTSVTSAQPEVLMGDVYMKLKAEGEKAVERIKEMAKGVNLEALVLSGRPANIVTGFAAKNRVDLIVVGSQGKSGLERLILGSVAESIIRMADCMVLVVKSE
jgi:nucleotide-binding universal stress UspA family protein